MMSFLTVVSPSRYSLYTTAENRSNLRQQATINNGRVTLQPIQGRQTSLAAGTLRTYTPRATGSNSGKQRTVICYNCKGEGHMSKQCKKPKRKRDDSWFKDKVLLVQAQASGQILHEEELAFLADPEIPEGQATTDVALMANLSHYGSDALAEVHNHDNVNNNMSNQAVQYLVIDQIRLVNSPEPNLSSRPTIVEVPKELPIVTMVYTSLKKLKHHLAGFDVVRGVKKLIAENEHLKQTYKQLYDSIKPARKSFGNYSFSGDLRELKRNALVISLAYIKHTQLEATVLRCIKPSTSASGSQPSGNTKKYKIQQTPSSTPKNKVEAHHRKVKYSLKIKDCVVAPKGTDNVQHSKVNANSELKCVKFQRKKFGNQQERCLPTLDISGDLLVGPSLIVGNACPLTRITTTTEVPLRIPSALDNETPKPVVTLVYSRKPRKSKTNGPVSKSKVFKFVYANKKEPSQYWGSIVSDVLSSSLDEYVCQIVLWYLDSGCSKHMTGDRSQLTNFVNKFLGTVKFGNDHVAKIWGFGDYQDWECYDIKGFTKNGMTWTQLSLLGNL
ncbi:retrovirus-related pol polyprotein from transposon TNT 1-94 [Tanacetum coccineum]